MKKNRVLVIEDEENIREIVDDILSAEDFDVIVAEDGHIGVILAQEHLPDLVICDIMMPEFDGYSVVRQLHQNPYTQSIPFVFLTARASEADMQLGMELGADDYLTKPFTKDALIQSVSTQLKKRTLAQPLPQPVGDWGGLQLLETLPQAFHQPLQRISVLANLLMKQSDIASPEALIAEITEIKIANQQVYRLVQNTLLYQVLNPINGRPSQTDWQRYFGVSTLTKQTIAQTVHQCAEPLHRMDDVVLNLEEATITVSTVVLTKIVAELVDHAFLSSLPGTPVQVWSVKRHQMMHLYVRDCGARRLNEDNIDGLVPQALAASHRDASTSSLGLLLVHRLVDLCRGTLQIEQVPGEGTTVLLQFPLTQTTQVISNSN